MNLQGELLQVLSFSTGEISNFELNPHLLRLVGILIKVLISIRDPDLAVHVSVLCNMKD